MKTPSRGSTSITRAVDLARIRHVGLTLVGPRNRVLGVAAADTRGWRDCPARSPAPRRPIGRRSCMASSGFAMTRCGSFVSNSKLETIYNQPNCFRGEIEYLLAQGVDRDQLPRKGDKPLHPLLLA